MHNTVLKMNNMLQEIHININKSHFALSCWHASCIHFHKVIKDTKEILNILKNLPELFT